MKYWKRTLSILIVFALSFGIFVGCTPESGIDVSGTHSDSHSQSSKPTDSAVPSDPSSHTPTDSAVPSDPSSHTPTDSASTSGMSSSTNTTDSTITDSTVSTNTSDTENSIEQVQDSAALIAAYFKKKIRNVGSGEGYEDLDGIYIEIIPALYEKEYTAEDFADVGDVEIVDVEDRRKVFGEETVCWKGFSLKFLTKSKETMVNAVNVLNQREDVFHIELVRNPTTG
ncbi:MAG: hypothetical protein IIV79_00805 [Clostridia bacterium]|nr:hypothetical protein [Clostridia bacterium]